MSNSRPKQRRSPSRAVRPVVAQLEDRLVMSLTLHQYLTLSQGLLNHPKIGNAYSHSAPPFLSKHAPRIPHVNRTIHAAAYQVIRGGQAVNVASVDGSHYRIQLGYISNTVATSAGDGAGGVFTQTTPTSASIIQPSEFPQPIGTVRVYPMTGGKLGIIVDGSNMNTELTINPLPQPIRKGYAHSFAYGQSGKGHLLNIGQVTVTSGSIGTIEGFHSADLSGPVLIPGTDPVDRIAFNSLQPGASITTGGDLNTLDVLQGVNLTTGTNIQIGRDLNLFNVGQNLTLSGGSKILIGRDMGAILQPPKGTGTGANVLSLNLSLVGTTFTGTIPPEVSAYFQGNLTIDPGSAFVVGRNVDQSIFIIGDVVGANRIIIPHSTVTPASNTIVSVGTFSNS
jgi:hypothetical protein